MTNPTQPENEVFPPLNPLRSVAGQLPPGVVVLTREQVREQTTDPLRMLIAVACVLGTGFALVKFVGPLGPNMIWLLAPVAFTLNLGLLVAINLVRRRHWYRKLVWGPFFAACMIAMFGLLCGTSVRDRLASVPAIQAFVEKDFAVLDVTGTGRITNAQLYELIRVQNVAESDALSLETKAIKTVQETEGDAALKATAFQGVEALRRNVVASLRPADQMVRIHQAAWNVCFAGTTFAGGNCQVTRDELLHFQDKLRQEYPLWIRVLATLHLMPASLGG